MYPIVYLFSIAIFLALCGFFPTLARPVVSTTALIEQKNKQLMQAYQKKRYTKCMQLIEQLLPEVHDRMERATLHFYQAYCSFYQKDYVNSSNQFASFIKQYPCAPEAEEAVFMRGYSLASRLIDLRLDQAVTYDAIRYLECYIAIYPGGQYQEKANHAIENLQQHLMKKHLNVACAYMQLGYWKAAILTLKNFEQSYPHSLLQQQVVELLETSYAKLAVAQSNKLGKKKRTTPVLF